eukprot:TRINITY_DN66461_c0_g1_i1.p1 TRINITY_DN66461_c0_g1~~TRINITY_DN66461_c0_g1_i1.p1  ORF type:complete len:370 (-),score=57.39 TRINITY_DN66461_c0_g1_i1:393-1502(-)
MAAAPEDARAQIVGALFLVTWMAFSSSFVVLMKITLTHFPYPLALTSIHMFSCWLCFGCVRLFPVTSVRERLMPDCGKEISWSDYFLAIVPIALLNSVGLALGNVAVKFASVAFLQMIKPANLIWGSLVAFAVRVEVASCTHMLIVGIVVSGVAISSTCTADFSAIGLTLQLFATFSEGAKLVMIQNVTGKRLKLDPLTAIFKYAPISFGCLLVLSYFQEGEAPWAHLRSDSTLVALNALAAVVLNILIVGTVSRTSAVVFILGGVLKDIGTIIASVIIFSSDVGVNQVVGFGMSLLGILMYKVYKQNLDVFLEFGCVEGFRRSLCLERRPDEDAAVSDKMAHGKVASQDVEASAGLLKGDATKVAVAA